MQRGASKSSSVHCILVYTPPYLSCQEGGLFFYSNLPWAIEIVVGKEGWEEWEEQRMTEGASVLNPATEWLLYPRTKVATRPNATLRPRAAVKKWGGHIGAPQRSYRLNSLLGPLHVVPWGLTRLCGVLMAEQIMTAARVIYTERLAWMGVFYFLFCQSKLK